MGATDTTDRVLASLCGQGPTNPAFTQSLDVNNGGVLLALPAPLHLGLLALMVLARVKSIERLCHRRPTV